MARLVERGVDLAVGYALGGLDRLVVPAAVALVELIMGVDTQQFIFQTTLRDRQAVGRDGDHVERGARTVAKRAAGEQRLDADHVPGGRHRQADLALDRAAARLGHAHRDLRFERVRTRRQLVELHRKARLALRIGRRQVFERLLGSFHLFIIEAELITGKAGPLLRHRDCHVAVEIEVGCWCAVQETAGDIDFGRRLRRDAAGRRRKIEFDPVRDIILNQKIRFPDRRPFRIGERMHVPRPGRCRGGQRQGEAMTAQSLVRDDDAAEFHTIGPFNNEGQRHIERGAAACITQHSGEISGLAGPVDAALGVDERIKSGRRGTAADTPVGEIESRRLEVQEGVVALSVADI